MELYVLITLAHIIGVVLGVGGASASDAVFFRSIKDKTFSRDEVGILRTLSYLIWTGLSLLFLSGLGFMWMQYSNTGTVAYLQAPWFQIKMIIVAAIFINGLVFHFKVFPFLRQSIDIKLSYGDMKPKIKLLAASGALSSTSWYSALFLGVTRGLNLSFPFLLTAYLFLVFCGIIGGFMMLTFMFYEKEPVADDSNIAA